MSLTRKCLDRKNFRNKLEQVKFDVNGEIMKWSLGQTVKKESSSNNRKSRQKTIKIVQDRQGSLREPSSCKNQKSKGHRLDLSKQSKQSRDSLLKSTHSYYIAHPKNKRSGSAADKHMKSHKSKDLTNTSNVINSTFQMQSFVSTHKKKKSNFSSTIGSKFDMVHLNKSVLNENEGKVKLDPLEQVLIKSETVLERYRCRYEVLQKQNKKYKKKYQEALRKIKLLENKL